MLKNRLNTTRVEWSPGCFSWQLMDDKKVSIKMEEIYPGGRSDAHFHTESIQFFFILEGEASFDLEDTRFDLKKHDGLEIPINKKHQIINSGDNNLIFLLISFPPIREDDIRV